MTPLAVEIMLECYCCVEPGANIPDRIWNSSAGKRERQRLVDLDLIHDDTLRATKLGLAFVEKICATPIPVDGP